MTFRDFLINIVIPTLSDEDIVFVQKAIEKLGYTAEKIVS